MIDFIPWWAWVVLAGGGLGALVWFVPGVLAAWSALPRTVRWIVAAVGAGFVAYFAGRNHGRDRELERQRALVEEAKRARASVNATVSKMSPSDVDKALAKNGDFRD